MSNSIISPSRGSISLAEQILHATKRSILFGAICVSVLQSASALGQDYWLTNPTSASIGATSVQSPFVHPAATGTYYLAYTDGVYNYWQASTTAFFYEFQFPGTSATYFTNRYLHVVLGSDSTRTANYSCPTYLTSSGANVGVTTRYYAGAGFPAGLSASNFSYVISGTTYYVYDCVYDLQAAGVYLQNPILSGSTASSTVPAFNYYGWNTAGANGRIYAVYTSTSSSTPYTASSTAFSAFLTDTLYAPSAINTPPLRDCDTLDIPCNFGNALQYVFYPSQASVDRFRSLTLASSSPFSYAYDMGTLRNELFANASTTAASSSALSIETGIGTINFISKAQLEAVPLSGFVKLILTWLLWLMLAEFFYIQILRVHNKEHK